MKTARRAVVRGGPGLARPECPVYSSVNSQHEDRLGEERRSAGLPRHRLTITARQDVSLKSGGSVSLNRKT